MAVLVLIGITCFPWHPYELRRAPATRIAWEPWHKTAYAEVAACLGKPTGFPGLTLFVVDSETRWAGMYAKHQVYLQRRFVSDTAVLKHEFVHHLEGIEGHGMLFWRFRECGFTPPWGVS